MKLSLAILTTAMMAVVAQETTPEMAATPMEDVPGETMDMAPMDGGDMVEEIAAPMTDETTDMVDMAPMEEEEMIEVTTMEDIPVVEAVPMTEETPAVEAAPMEDIPVEEGAPMAEEVPVIEVATMEEIFVFIIYFCVASLGVTSGNFRTTFGQLEDRLI